MNKIIPYLNLKIEDENKRKKILNAIEKVLIHGRFILGPEVEKLERTIAKHCNRKYAIGVGSGTDALFLALKSLGVGQGDEVITSSVSWIATANAIALIGATPVFADITDELNIDPDSILRLITPKTKVILPVHYTGKVCQVDKILDIAKAHNLLVIEDACQAFNATYNGKIAGSFGDIGCFSMNPMKVFPSCGEAGMVVTDDENIYNQVIALRYNGLLGRSKCIEPSFNARLDTIQAAIMLSCWDEIALTISIRRKVANAYNERLKDIVKIPGNIANSSCYMYCILVDKREELIEYLKRSKIETQVRDSDLFPVHSPYKNMKSEYGNAKKLITQLLSIPANEKTTLEEVEFVSEKIKVFYK